MATALTDAQVERIAREYCKLRGVDPDKLQSHAAKPDPVTHIQTLQVCYSPSWKLAAEFVRQRADMDEAFRIGTGPATFTSTESRAGAFPEGATVVRT